MNVFFVNCIDHAGLGPSADCLKVVDLATVVTLFTIYQKSSWFMLLSTVLAFLFGNDCVTCMLFAPEPILMCTCIKVS